MQVDDKPCVMCKRPTTFVLVDDVGRYIPVCSDRCERRYERWEAIAEDEDWGAGS